MTILLQIIHPVCVGREEDVSGRALFDLPRQGGRGAEGERHGHAARGFICFGDCLQAVGERGGSKDREILGHCSAGLQDERQHREQRGATASGQDISHDLAFLGVIYM